MTFQPVALDTLPKRIVKGRGFDLETANALLSVVSQNGQGASDGETYKDQDEARKAAGKARRLLVRVAPNADLVRSRVYSTGDNEWHWVVSLGTEETAKAKKASK